MHTHNILNVETTTARGRKVASAGDSSLWSVHQTATFLGYADGTVRNLIAGGRLPKVKLATGATRIPSDAVRAFAYGRSPEAKGHNEGPR
jgi:hypothetical protein